MTFSTVHNTSRPFKDDKQRNNVMQIVSAIKQCSKTLDLDTGKRLHHEAIATNLHTNKFITAALITMYSKCRCMALAQEVFDQTLYRDVVMWNSLIQGYASNGEALPALHLFDTMECKPSSITFIAASKACGALAESQAEKRSSLEKGISIHQKASRYGLDTDELVSTSLIDMYSKCGSLDHARDVFSVMSRRDVVSWTSLILGCVDNSDFCSAIDLFACMDCKPDSFTYVAILKAYGGLAEKGTPEKAFCLMKVIKAHRQVLDSGVRLDQVLGSALVDVYCKCSVVVVAFKVFKSMPRRDVVTWNSLILGHVENGEIHTALELFTCMDCQPDSFTFVAVLKALGILASHGDSNMKFFLLERGVTAHKLAKQLGAESELMVANTLVDMYGKFGHMKLARGVFDVMVSRSVVSWTSLMLGYVTNREFSVAMDLFSCMDCRPSPITYTAALKACGALANGEKTQKEFCLRKGICIHQDASVSGFDRDLVVATNLIEMYGALGYVRHARVVFEYMPQRDVIAWTSLVLAYVENGEMLTALDLYVTMDCEPDSITFLGVFKALAGLAAPRDLDKAFCMGKGVQAHRQLKERGVDPDVILSNSLIDMYGKCGSISHAKEVFDGVTIPSIVSWNTLILGYVENNLFSAAVETFTSMDCEPDSITYVAALKATGSLNAFSTGRAVHGSVCRLGLEQQDNFVMTALVDFYSKCGNMDKSEELFDNLSSPDIVSWTTLVRGYCATGDFTRVFDLTREMQEGGVARDSVTFTAILAACSHAGMVEEARMFLEVMRRCVVRLDVEQYNCMVDVLGRANRLREALEVIRGMGPVQPNAVTWRSLLGACRKWRNLEVGKVAFQELVALNAEEKAPAYVLLSDIYASLSMWEEVESIRRTK